MSHRVNERQNWGVVSRLLELASDERAWLATAIAAGLLVYGIYLTTHPYPAYGAGLYLQIAREISAHGYALPTRIPGYTVDGVPFGYPPLMYYVSAVLMDATGVDPITLSRLLPGFVVVLSLVPFYYLASEVLESTPRAGFATLLLAVAPPALQWHLSAGGIVRSPAFLFALTGAYTGLRLFRTGNRTWLAPSGVLFGLTVLTHPVYTVYFGTTYLVMYAWFDRSLSGLLNGAAVAATGLLLASPWWTQIVATHGVGVFTAASGTHTGIGGGVQRLLGQLVYPLDLDASTGFYLGAYAGGAYLLSKRRGFLPIWLVTAAFVLGKVRFQFPAGAMMASVFVFEVVVPRVRALYTRTRYRWSTPLAAIIVLGMLATASGGAYAAGMLNTHHQSTSQPAFVDDEDLAAMNWAEENTAQSADFVVLGDAAEWFPLMTDRSIAVGPWGVEWEGHDPYRNQLQLYKHLSRCPGVACLGEAMIENDVSPDYIYVPKGHYTVRGVDTYQKSWMRDRLMESYRYDLRYENEGVMVFEVTDDLEPVEFPDDVPRPR